MISPLKNCLLVVSMIIATACTNHGLSPTVESAAAVEPMVTTAGAVAGTPPLTATPVRGVWLTNSGSQALYSRAGINEAVDRCAANGINHIFVVMWNKGRTLYPSRIMQQTFGIPIEEKLAGRDPLRELLDAARQKNIRVYAWFEYGFAAENSGLGEHILRLKPQWAARNAKGAVLVKNGFKWMNGFDPQVQQFMLSLLKEIVQTYPDLTGIQGDDRLPAMPVEAGYNAGLTDAYKAQHNGTAPPADEKNAAWIDWRASRLNQFMKQLHDELKQTRADVKISMAPSIYPFSKTQYLQDWPTWVKNGWVDMVCPQIYRYEIMPYRNELAKIVGGQLAANKLNIMFPGVLVKITGQTFTTDYLKQVVRENRKNNIAGEVFFYYEGLKEQPEFFNWYKNQ